MAVIKGRVITEREIASSGKTLGGWAFVEKAGRIFTRRGSRDEYELKSLLDVLKDEQIEVETPPEPQAKLA